MDVTYRRRSPDVLGVHVGASSEDDLQAAAEAMGVRIETTWVDTVRGVAVTDADGSVEVVDADSWLVCEEPGTTWALDHQAFRARYEEAR